MDGTGNDSGQLFTVWCQNSHHFSPTSARTGPWNRIFNVQLLQQGLEPQKTPVCVSTSPKFTRTYSPLIKKTLGSFMLWPCKCLMPNRTLRMKHTHSLSQPKAYCNIPQLSSTWHSATKVLISSCWILLKLSVCLIYFVHSMVRELSMCLVVFHHHLPSSTLVTWFGGFPWWLLQAFSASRSLHVMKSTSLVASPRVSRKSRTTWSKFSLGGWKSGASNTKVDVGWFLSLSQNTKSRSIAKRLEP